MKILWFTWKDTAHPLAGGAEVMNEELAKRAVEDGHEVTFLVGGFKGGKKEEIRDGIRFIRVGNRFTVYAKAAMYYMQHLGNWPNIIIEEINTVPFFTHAYAKQKKVLMIYQLAREIWFHEMTKPLSYIGYALEPIYLNLLSKIPTMTESESTKIDLQKYGFKADSVTVIPPGTTIPPVKSLDDVKKFKDFTVLSVGAIRSMKQTLHQIEAFELLKQKLPEAKMIVVGGPFESYGEKVMNHIKASNYAKDIDFRGFVLQSEKLKLMQKAHVITVTSIKEGWGLIVTEANGQGTPAAVYNVDGLRDAVQDGKTGLITKENTPESLAQTLLELADNKKLYRKLQKAAWSWSKELNFDNSYKIFKDYIENEA